MKIPNRRQEYAEEAPSFNDEKLTEGTYLVVMQPWPDKLIPHNHPFRRGVKTMSWPIRFEEVIPQGPIPREGRTITLWCEAEPTGAIIASQIGEGRWRPLADALGLQEGDVLETEDLAWSAVVIVVKSKVRKDKTISAWITEFIPATPDQVMKAGDYLGAVHPDE